ncbi:MAG: hydantoinase B/oxoprolinase family protein [Actinobacteria bacterium]|nr:hydantoinase B/oxoprolinase family protein [Actinomycetota bacterium]
MTTTVAAPTLLRDLDEDAFGALYDTDRFTATVFSNRLRYSVQHVATGLLHRAFSPIIALAYDFAAAICGPPEQGYQMAAVTDGLTVFLGTMADGVRVAVEEYGIENLKPGDLLICNDPSRMGNHPNDVCFIRPVFRDGRTACFMVIRSHQTDVGGIAPGGFSGRKRNSYENGLVISPRLLYAGGEPVRETFSMIFDNVRLAQQLLPDLKTTQGCCELGEQLIQESIDRYGIDAFLGTLRYLCDGSAEAMRTALASIPDGDYEGVDSIDADGIDADEEYRVRIVLRKRGSRLEADFSGSSRQARTCINGGALDAKTAIGVGLKILLDPESDFTSGTFREFDLVLPAGTITTALPPEGGIFFYMEVTNLIMTVLIRALANALGEDAIGGDYGTLCHHNGYGTTPDGTPWAASAVAGGETGPWGASKAGDADGHSCSYLLNFMAPPSELLELGFPLMILRREYVPDTGGVGFNRGGPGVLKDIMWTAPAEHETTPLRFRHRPGVGVAGGADGAGGGVWIFGRDGREVGGRGIFVDTDPAVYAEAVPVAGTLDPATQVPDPAGEYAYFCSSPVWQTQPGAMWRYVTNAGGGWGDPFERDPERVKLDVRDGYVTLDGARRDFGVVIVGDPHRAPEKLEVDAAATAAERAQAKTQQRKGTV